MSPLIYDRDDSNDYDPIEERRRADAEFDRNTPQQTLTVNQYIWGTAAVVAAILVAIFIANLAAG